MNKTMAGVTLAAILLAFGAQAQDAREGGPTEIEKCQTIDKSGSYKLLKNLTFNGPAGSACLSITASFVTIDLAGFTITGISPSGGGPLPTTSFPTAIEAGGNTTGITVRNGSISGHFNDGVALSGDGSIVEGLHVSNLAGANVVGTVVGIRASGIVRGNTVLNIFGIPGNGNGVEASGLITGNYVSDTRTGIITGGSTVIGNTVRNSERGIVVGCPSNVTDNTATGNVDVNLELDGTGCNNTNNVAP
jgi:hypothetical protein